MTLFHHGLQPSEAISPIKCFLLSLALAVTSYHSNRKLKPALSVRTHSRCHTNDGCFPQPLCFGELCYTPKERGYTSHRNQCACLGYRTLRLTVCGQNPMAQNVLYLPPPSPTPECKFLTTAFDGGDPRSQKENTGLPKGTEETTNLAFSDALMQP